MSVEKLKIFKDKEDKYHYFKTLEEAISFVYNIIK